MYYDKQSFSSTEEVNKELDKVREEFIDRETELIDIVQNMCKHKNVKKCNTLNYLSKVNGIDEKYFYCNECGKYFKEGEI